MENGNFSINEISIREKYTFRRAYPCSTALNFVCAGNASGPATSGTTRTRTSNTGPTQASTSPIPTPTTTCPCNGRAFYGDLAVVFELKDPALDITRVRIA